jgi:DNA-binding transcriptional ArsR family regulator
MTSHSRWGLHSAPELGGEGLRPSVFDRDRVIRELIEARSLYPSQLHLRTGLSLPTVEAVAEELRSAGVVRCRREQESTEPVYELVPRPRG